MDDKIKDCKLKIKSRKIKIKISVLACDCHLIGISKGIDGRITKQIINLYLEVKGRNP